MKGASRFGEDACSLWGLMMMMMMMMMMIMIIRTVEGQDVSVGVCEGARGRVLGPSELKNRAHDGQRGIPRFDFHLTDTIARGSHEGHTG